MTPFILSGIGKKVPHCMTFVHEDKGSILDLIKTNCLILQPTFLTFHGIKVIFDFKDSINICSIKMWYLNSTNV